VAVTSTSVGSRSFYFRTAAVTAVLYEYPLDIMPDGQLQCACWYQMSNLKNYYAYVTKRSAGTKHFFKAPLSEHKHNQSHVITRKRRNNSRSVTDRSQGTDWQRRPLEREAEKNSVCIYWILRAVCTGCVWTVCASKCTEGVSNEDVWDEDMMYLLSAVWLTPGGSGTVHIYTQTIHRKTQWNRIHRTEHTYQ